MVDSTARLTDGTLRDPNDASDGVFLDAQVFEAASFNFTTTAFVSLQEQLESGRLRLILTDTTRRSTQLTTVKR
jgi:hypothetical protein